MSIFSKLFGGGKGSSYEAAPYTGRTAPSVSFLRPVEKQIYEILMRRSLGQDVGFDPERRRLLTELVKSEIGKQEEDQLRAAKGALFTAGLSGNPRAYEAMSGRVKRDVGRTLGDEMARIAIEDLTRANEERDINTARLQALNEFNFNQENQAAASDLNQYQATEAARQAAADNALIRGALRSSGISGLIRTGLSLAADRFTRGMSLAPLALFGMGGSGYGISPTGVYSPYTNLKESPIYRNRLGYF